MPAPNDPHPTTDDLAASSTNASSAFPIAAHGLSILSVVLGAYALLVGVSILRGVVSVSAAHFLMVPVPLALALWFGFGFMQSPSKVSQNAASHASLDFGLLTLCAGWGLTALSLLVPQGEAGNASVTATVCGVLGLLCIAMGSVLSLRAWMDGVQS